MKAMCRLRTAYWICLCVLFATTIPNGIQAADTNAVVEQAKTNEAADHSARPNVEGKLAPPDRSKPTSGDKKAGSNVPADVLVSVYIINLGKFDIGSGSFTVDFYLQFDHDAGVDPTNFEFVNGRASSSDLMISTPTQHFYRIQADLVSSIDLRQYPFDHQLLQIIIEDKRSTIEKLRYVPLLAQTELDKTVNFVGWQITGWEAFTRSHAYKVWNEVYSQYVFEVQISRIAFNSFMKTFLPVFFIVLIVLSSFTMGPDQVGTRLGMAGSGLVASVMFHVSISSQIPPVGYLTFADKFMALTYLITLVSFMIDVAILAAQQHGSEKIVNRIHRSTEISMFIIVPLAYVLLFVFVH